MQIYIFFWTRDTFECIISEHSDLFFAYQLIIISHNKTYPVIV